MRLAGTATPPPPGSHVHSQSTAFLGGLSIVPDEVNDEQPTRIRNRAASSAPQPANDAGRRIDRAGGIAGVVKGSCFTNPGRRTFLIIRASSFCSNSQLCSISQLDERFSTRDGRVERI